MRILTWIRCHIFKFHNWTTDLEQRNGKPMEGLDTTEKILSAFVNDCRMYCKDCKHESEFNDRLKDLIKK